jgi:hypothetical protein
MGIIQKAMRQDAIYWAPLPATPDGQPAYGDPVAIRCRWETSTQQIIKANGDTITVGHTLGPTSILLTPGGRVVLGTLKSLATPTDPIACGAVEVQVVAHTPNLRQKKHLYEAWC